MRPIRIIAYVYVWNRLKPTKSVFIISILYCEFSTFEARLKRISAFLVNNNFVTVLQKKKKNSFQTLFILLRLHLGPHR